jgi:hypothetical protein
MYDLAFTLRRKKLMKDTPRSHILSGSGRSKRGKLFSPGSGESLFGLVLKLEARLRRRLVDDLRYQLTRTKPSVVRILKQSKSDLPSRYVE